MTHQEFKKVKIGDIVVITEHGINRGKKGVVVDIGKPDGFRGGSVYLEPIDCEFKFSDMSSAKRLRFKGDLCRFKHSSIAFERNELEFGIIVRNSQREDRCKLIVKVYKTEASVNFKIPLKDEPPEFWGELTTLVDKYFKD